jgi:hypothetical protein
MGSTRNPSRLLHGLAVHKCFLVNFPIYLSAAARHPAGSVPRWMSAGVVDGTMRQGEGHASRAGGIVRYRQDEAHGLGGIKLWRHTDEFCGRQAETAGRRRSFRSRTAISRWRCVLRDFQRVPAPVKVERAVADLGDGSRCDHRSARPTAAAKAGRPRRAGRVPVDGQRRRPKPPRPSPGRTPSPDHGPPRPPGL